MPKTKDVQERMDDDEDTNATSIYDRYAARHNNLETMCLAKFAANYEPCSFEQFTVANVCKDMNDEENDKESSGTRKQK